LQSVSEFIRLYTTQNNRWPSPKFVVGESYGGTRAAAIAETLADRFDLYLNGIIIVSGVLDFETLDFKVDNDLGYALYLPSYTAAAWYHKMLPPSEQQKTEDEVRHEAEAYAAKDYPYILSQGSALSEGDRAKAAARLTELTGLPTDTVVQNHLRITPGKFRDELLKQQHKTIGRFDTRITGLAYNPDGADFEPSFVLIRGTFTALINTYLRSELKFQTDIPYHSLTNVSPWNMVENRYLEVTNPLALAMMKNPRLKVWVISGYYDLAVAYFATDYALRQMHLDPSLRSNLRFNKYEGGHMLYSTEPILKQFTADFDDFITSALK
jgi:carboxypeptidase C (cathepsin A)